MIGVTANDLRAADAASGRATSFGSAFHNFAETLLQVANGRGFGKDADEIATDANAMRQWLAQEKFSANPQTILKHLGKFS